MRATALFIALSLFSFPTLSKGAIKAECPERIAHLGGLLAGITQEQQTEAESLVALLQENGLFYSALVESLRARGITPQKPQAWKLFVSDFYLLPERQAVVDETASRLILEFFASPTDTIDQAITQGERTALGVGFFIEARKIFRKIEPMNRWSDIVEHAIFVQNRTIIAELKSRMRRFFPRASRTLLPFPPSLSEVRNAYAVLPKELVVFDARRRLMGSDAAEAALVANDLKNAGHGELGIAQQALVRAYQLRQVDNQARGQRARILALQTLAEIDQTKQALESEAAAKSIPKIQERITRLEQKRGKILRRLLVERDSKIERARLAQRPVEKTASAVVTMREADRARIRFSRAMRDWRKLQQPAPPSPAPEPLSLAAQLSRYAIENALYTDKLDSQQLETALLGNQETLTSELFTHNAVYMLHYVADGDIEFSDNDLVALAEAVLNAARKLNFKLSIAQVEKIRDEMKEAGDYLDDPESVENDETAQFRRAQNNLDWLKISDTSLFSKSPPTEFEQELREADFAFEVDRLDSGETDQINFALISLFSSARGLTSEQLTSMVERFFDGLSTNYESTQTRVVESVCVPFWTFEPGLSEEQIARVRAAISTFTENIEEADNKKRIRAAVYETPWLHLAALYSPIEDVAAEPNLASPIATTALQELAMDAPKLAQEELPEEIQALRRQAQSLSDTARLLRQDPESARAYDTEKRLRADLKTVLSKMDQGTFDYNVTAVEEILDNAYESLSTDRFTAVFNEFALLYAFKQEVSSEQDEETAYCKMLLEFLKSTHLSSKQAASIGATFIRILGLTNEKGTSLVGSETKDTIVPDVCEWILGLPQGIEVADADTLRKALRDLATIYDSPEWDLHASAVWLLRWASDTRWIGRTERTPTSTEERLRDVERELAENEVELQQARAVIQSVQQTP